jgi:TPR repeat protein
MQDLPRQKLRELIAEHGLSLCDDPRRVEAMLKDLCGQHKREIFVLVSAMKERVVEDLRNSQATVPTSILLPRLAKRLHDNLGLTEDIASWAVETWAWVLGFLQNPISNVTVSRGEYTPDNQNDSTSALKEVQKLADQGNADAQMNLGFIYEYGRGIIQNATEAVKWYLKAAEQGNAEAQYNLGRKYEDGRGLIRNDLEAAKWYRKAAKQGNANAQNNLGWMYMTGCGVPQDYGQAHFWFSKSAEQGNSSAINNLNKINRKVKVKL